MGHTWAWRLATRRRWIERNAPDRGEIGDESGRAWEANWRAVGVGSVAGVLPPWPRNGRSGQLVWWSSGVGGPTLAGGTLAGQGHSGPLGFRSGRLGGGLAWRSSGDEGAKGVGGLYEGWLTDWRWFSPLSLAFVPDLVDDVVILLCFCCVKFPLRVVILMFGCLIPRRVFATPIRPEPSFGPHFLPDAGSRGKLPSYLMITELLHSVQLYFAYLVFVIPRMGVITPTWPELGFGSPFLREIMLLGNWLFPIWYSDSLQEIIFCKRIITVGDGFVPQSLAGDPVLVVYILGVFCIFNGFVCLFHGTSLFRDLYVLLIEPFSAVMDFVQFNH